MRVIKVNKKRFLVTLAILHVVAAPGRFELKDVPPGEAELRFEAEGVDARLERRGRCSRPCGKTRAGGGPGRGHRLDPGGRDGGAAARDPGKHGDELGAAHEDCLAQGRGCGVEVDAGREGHARVLDLDERPELRGVLPAGEELDAALLQMAPLRFLPSDDPRLHATVDATWRSLSADDELVAPGLRGRAHLRAKR